jgi:hypothetical protein
MTQVGVLWMRVWREEAGALRARIVAEHDVERPHGDSVAVAGVEDACAVVRRWLEELSADPDLGLAEHD